MVKFRWRSYLSPRGGVNTYARRPSPTLDNDGVSRMTPNSIALSESASEIAPPNLNGRSEAIAEISRKWLAGIDPSQFRACHEYLLAVRLARHMTKTDVVTASMLNGDPASGVSLPTVSKIESGTYGEPGFRTMIRLARGYGISVSSLERFFV
jgi:hypothetical protein